MTETVKAIKRTCEEMGLSQANLARRTKITETSISRWFKGTRQPTIENVEKMCEALGVKLLVFR